MTDKAVIARMVWHRLARSCEQMVEKRVLRVWLIGLLCLLGSVSARAETYFATGDDLVTQCSAKDETSAGLCLGYVSGAIDMQTLQDQTVGECLAFHMPEKVSRAEVSKAVVDYLAQHPNAAGDPASYAVYQAMAAVYPCPK